MLLLNCTFLNPFLDYEKIEKEALEDPARRYITRNKIFQKV
jgi:hypothetical protein